MTRKLTLQIAALLGALSVIIGAFGAHGLHDLLIENNRLDVFEKAVMYQCYHSLALLLVAILMRSNESRYLNWSAGLFVFGVFIFSGSLYALSVTNFTIFGAITPIGGILFILGWLALFLFANSEQHTVTGN